MQLIMLTPLRHSDTNENNESSHTINKILASSDVYIAAHMLRGKGTKRLINIVLTTTVLIALISLCFQRDFLLLTLIREIAWRDCRARYVAAAYAALFDKNLRSFL